MRIIINSKEHETSCETLLALLEECGFRCEFVAVEHNGEVVKRDEWSAFKLKERDKFEVVQFVAGG